MTCQELIDFLMDYLEGDLPTEQHVAFEMHLKCCPPCADYLASYQECITLGRKCVKCESDEVPPDMPEELVRAILAARRKSCEEG